MSYIRTLWLSTCVAFVSSGMALAQSPLKEENFKEFQQLLSPSVSPPKPGETATTQAPPVKDCTTNDAFAELGPIDMKAGRSELPCKVDADKARGTLMMWNQIALDTTAIDHAPAQPGSNSRGALQHLGPHRSARAMAIVHIAMYDAINDISQYAASGNRPYRYESYLKRTSPIDREADTPSAISAAAFVSLCELYSAQTRDLRALYEKAGGELEQPASTQFPNKPCAIKPNMTDEKVGLGAKIGAESARDILDKRKVDGSQIPEPQVGDPGFILEDAPGKWRPDPISGLTTALGGRWGEVETFSGFKSARFRPPPPPPLTDAVYTRDYDEVKKLGGLYQTERRGYEAFIGRFWAYDGTAFLCAPPRLYNQIVRTLILDPNVAAKASKLNTMGKLEKNLDVIDTARIFALVNTAMADAAISAWEAKYNYRFWRPVTGIRAAASDGNPLTIPDPTWVPLGAPATNSQQMPNFTPPFPAYPSGHAVFGGAVFEMLRRFFYEDTSFVFISDEYNGKNAGFGDAGPRPKLPQSFISLSHPEYLNARSRVYLGVHWQFDADVGIAQGNQVGSFVFANRMQCLDEEGGVTACDLNTGLHKAPEKKVAENMSGAPAAKGETLQDLMKQLAPFSGPPIGSTTLPSGVVIRPLR